MICKSRECVSNIPSADLATKVVSIVNTSGRDVEKFARFDLTAGPSQNIKAPLIDECFTNFECKVIDTKLVTQNGLFILEVVKAQVAVRPKYPERIHYRGDGVFMNSRKNTGRFRRLFTKQNV